MAVEQNGHITSTKSKGNGKQNERTQITPFLAEDDTCYG
jgi:hypothetical protein